MQGNYFHPLTFGRTDSPLAKKNCRAKSRFFVSSKFDFTSYISSKNEIKEDHSKRSKVDNLELDRKRSYSDQ